MGSILLALFLDAAWDYRTDRVQEAEYIEGLREEFQANQRELSVDAARRDEMATLTARALLATETGGPALEADSARLVIGALLDYRFYSPSEAVLNDLISSGSLSILRSAELRRALMQYLQECERLRVAEERERDFAAGALEPYLVDHLTLSQAPAAASGIGPALNVTELPALWRDSSFRSLVVLRQNRSGTVSRFSQGVTGQVERVLEALGE